VSRILLVELLKPSSSVSYLLSSCIICVLLAEDFLCETRLWNHCQDERHIHCVR